MAAAAAPERISVDEVDISEVEIAEAYTLIAEREKEADKARIIAEMDRVGHAVLPNMLDEATRQQLMAALRQDLEEASES